VTAIELVFLFINTYSGKYMSNRVPSISGRETTSINPSCDLTQLYTVDSPRPRPSPISFVVKKGSNIKGFILWLIPPPLSVTEITIYFPDVILKPNFALAFSTNW
jgi:hypothetical protein